MAIATRNLAPDSGAVGIVTGGFQAARARKQHREHQPVAPIGASIEEFICGTDGLGLGDEPFPRVVTTIAELLDGGYTDPRTGEVLPYLEAFLEWGIGAGKDYAASVYLLCKSARVLQGMIAGTFWFQHGLAHGSRIELAHFAPDQESATEVLHAELVAKAFEAPWFRRYARVDDRLKKRIRFRRSPHSRDHWPLEIVPRGCSLSKRLGRNLYAATIDEANFWANSGGVRGDEVVALYNAVTRRLRSRFGGHGQLLMIASSNYDGDLSSRKQREAQDPARRIFYSKAASWEVKPPSRYDGKGETFTFEQKDDQGKVVRVWPGIPVDLKGDFETDPHLALRDYAGVRYGDEQTFDPDAQWLFQEAPVPEGRGPIPGWPSPFLRPYELDPSCRPLPDADYFLRFDLATSGDVSADALGVALVHAEILEDGELFETAAFAGEPYRNAVVVVDFAARVTPADVGGERSLEATRQFVYDLQAQGFRLACVSYDGYQSTDSRQILAQQGVTTSLLSVDRTPAPYQTLKRLAHAGRLIYGPAAWLEEYRWLRIVRGNKVDHLPGKEKDVADAVAGAAHQCWHHVVAHLAGDRGAHLDERVIRLRQQREREDAERLARYEQRQKGRRR